MKVRKRPVIVEAVQWDESNKTLDAIGVMMTSCSGHRDNPDLCFDLRIETLEGSMRVSKGDWIIRGIKGEFYPCKPDIFEKTYEPMNAPLSPLAALADMENTLNKLADIYVQKCAVRCDKYHKLADKIIDILADIQSVRNDAEWIEDDNDDTGPVAGKVGKDGSANINAVINRKEGQDGMESKSEGCRLPGDRPEVGQQTAGDHPCH